MPILPLCPLFYTYKAKLCLKAKKKKVGQGQLAKITCWLDVSCFAVRDSSFEGYFWCNFSPLFSLACMCTWLNDFL